MTLTDFLVARSLESLDAAGCRYRVVGARVVCECETIPEPVQEALADLDLVRASDMALGPDNSISRILADKYATHPDYRPEWHHLGRPDSALARRVGRTRPAYGHQGAPPMRGPRTPTRRHRAH